MSTSPRPRALTSALVALTIGAAGVVAAPAASAAPREHVVTSVEDGGDTVADGTCAADADQPGAGECTLRAALDEANRQDGEDLVSFAIPGDGPHTIQLTDTPLPALTNAGTTIDGYTQPGSSVNTDPLISNAVLQVQIRAGGPRSLDPLTIVSGGNTVRGLSIFDAHRPLGIFGTSAVGNRIVGNFIGTDAAGEFGHPAPAATAFGISIGGGANGTVVGTADPADRNIVSGNASTGIYLAQAGTSGTLIQGNIVGLRPDGTGRLGNDFGIDFNRGASDNLVGGTREGEGNVISGNRSEGLEFSHDPETARNEARGNLIGPDPTGEVSDGFGNGTYAVVFEDEARDNYVADNVIVGSPLGLVRFTHPGTTDNVLRDNLIGATRTGATDSGTDVGVIVTQGAAGNVLAGGNTITGTDVGVQVFDDVADNSIRLTATSVFGNRDAQIDVPPLGARGAQSPYPDAPVIESAAGETVQGTACPGCRVEVFQAQREADGQAGSLGYLGATEAEEDGTFSLTTSGLQPGLVTATATTEAGATGELAEPVTVAGSMRRVRYAP